MGPIDKVYGKIKHFCLPTGTKPDLDVWMTGIRLAKVRVILIVGDLHSALTCCVCVYNGTKDYKKRYKAPTNLHFSLVVCMHIVQYVCIALYV